MSGKVKTIDDILDLTRRRERELRWTEIRQAYKRLRQDARAWNDSRPKPSFSTKRQQMV